MGERYKSIFLTILSLAVVWFIIILLCLPRDDPAEQWSPSKAELKSDYESAARVNEDSLNKTETLFYQLELDPNATINVPHTLAKELHEKLTLKLGSEETQTDRYVKSQGYNLFAFNLLVSNRIGLFRPIPDTRNPKCPLRRSLEQASLDPSQSFYGSAVSSKLRLKASIVICYYNEAPSALLRTVYTILKRSPIELLQEIIIIDDSSEPEYSYKTVEHLIRSDLVTMVQTNKREGLIRARLFGARLAKGDVLIFLDSHIEANIGWLEPLIQAVQENRTTIACPMIDPINPDSLIYSGSPMVKGGLSWALHFKWDSVPSDKLKTYDDFVKPIESPTMAGGLYAIDRKYFHELGEYDAGMDLWGGENIEMSLRTWMCGGRIVILSCSRMGHIFRKKRPYGPKPGEPDSLLANSHRAARVWLDDYLYKYYEASPEARYLKESDISPRLELKKLLGCKNFSWYMDNVYPDLKKELDISISSPKPNNNSKPKLSNIRPNRATKWHSIVIPNQIGNRIQRQVPYSQYDLYKSSRPAFFTPQGIINSDRSKHMPKIIAQFQIQLKDTNYCIESNTGFFAKGFARLVLNHCTKLKTSDDGEIMTNSSSVFNQLWTETDLHDFRLGDNFCLDLIKNLPLMRRCHNIGSFQTWATNLSNQTVTADTYIYSTSGGLCLGVERASVGEPIIVTICDSPTQNVDVDLDRRKVRSHHHQHLSKMINQRLKGTLHPSRRWQLLFISPVTKT